MFGLATIVLFLSLLLVCRATTYATDGLYKNTTVLYSATLTVVDTATGTYTTSVIALTTDRSTSTIPTPDIGQYIAAGVGLTSTDSTTLSPVHRQLGKVSRLRRCRERLRPAPPSAALLQAMAHQLAVCFRATLVLIYAGHRGKPTGKTALLFTPKLPSPPKHPHGRQP